MKLHTDYLLQENYLHPVNNLFTSDVHIDYAKTELDNILTQSVIISQMSNGISYTDVEDMDEYERVFILKKIIQMEKDKLDAKKRAIEEAKMNKK